MSVRVVVSDCGMSRCKCIGESVGEILLDLPVSEIDDDCAASCVGDKAGCGDVCLCLTM